VSGQEGIRPVPLARQYNNNSPRHSKVFQRTDLGREVLRCTSLPKGSFYRGKIVLVPGTIRMDLPISTCVLNLVVPNGAVTLNPAS
jgi:hypothetical protein